MFIKEAVLCGFIYCCPGVLLLNCNSFPLLRTRRLLFKSKQLFPKYLRVIRDQHSALLYSKGDVLI